MKTTKKQLFTKALLFMGVVMFALVSCKKEDPAPDPIASFQYEISATNYLMVTFTNFSQNATTFSWAFGDGGTSTDENPVHTYTAEGTFNVVLTVKNKDGVEHAFQTAITITDPDKALKKLTGEVSKTWKLYRVESSMGVGPDAGNPRGWWALFNDGSRPCVYNHEFTFTLAGAYIFNDKGFFWSEGLTDPPTCIAAIPANMVNLAGADVSAWLSGTHSFEYTPSTGMVTLTGLGAWIGLPKTGTTGEVSVPQNSVTFKIVSIEEFDGYDLMNVRFVYDWGVWDFTYASYTTATEPAVVSFMADFSLTIDDFTVTFTNLSKDAVSYSWNFGDGNTSTAVNPVHTYAAEGVYEVVLTATSASGETKTATKNVSISLNPTTLAPAPTEPAANVISIYSDTYTNITGVNIDPDWGQGTVTTEIEVLGEKVIKMAGLNYQGIDFAGNAQNVSGKTKLHVDVYCVVATDIQIFVISPGKENSVTVTTEAGVWKSFDILLSNYTTPNLSDVIQFKFEATGSPTIFVDNIYFY
jgi:PKD repeat protein